MTADTGREAICRLRQHHPDLALVDTALSDIDRRGDPESLLEGGGPPPMVWSAHDSGHDFWSLDTHIVKTPNFFKIKSKIKEHCPSEERNPTQGSGHSMTRRLQ